MLLKILTVNFVDLDSHPPKFRFHKLAELFKRKFIHSVIFLIFYFSVPHLPDNDLVLASSNNCSNINYVPLKSSLVWSKSPSHCSRSCTSQEFQSRWRRQQHSKFYFDSQQQQTAVEEERRESSQSNEDKPVIIICSHFQHNLAGCPIFRFILMLLFLLTHSLFSLFTFFFFFLFVVAPTLLFYDECANS